MSFGEMLVANARAGISLREQESYSRQKVQHIYYINQRLDARDNQMRLWVTGNAFAGGEDAMRELEKIAEGGHA